MHSKTLLPVAALCFLFFLPACEQEEPKYLMETASTWNYTKWCCEKPGDNCIQEGTGWTLHRVAAVESYIKGDSVAAFFKRPDWTIYFPELGNRPEIVDYLIANNPKIVIQKDFGYVILKDRRSPVATDNIFFAVKTTGNASCSEWLEDVPKDDVVL